MYIDESEELRVESEDMSAAPTVLYAHIIFTLHSSLLTLLQPLAGFIVNQKRGNYADYLRRVHRQREAEGKLEHD